MGEATISAISAAEFDQAVIERSRTAAVLVDFWADWCGPCHSLAPILEELAAQHPVGLFIVKIDSDAEPDLAARFGVRSLPSLLLFRDGERVDQTLGAQPLGALKAFVSPHLPRPTDASLAAGRAALTAGEVGNALASLREALSSDQTDYRIHPLLAEALLADGQTDEARELLGGLPANVAIEEAAQKALARLELLDAAQAGEPADPMSEIYQAAMSAAAAGDYDTAVPALLDLLGRERDWREGALRRALLDIFKVLGDDPRLKPWRTAMARLLN